MAAPSFDSARAVRIDLARGRLTAGSDEGSAGRLVLVPASALADFVGSAPAANVDALGRGIGEAIGRRVAERVGGPQPASVEHFVTQLAGEVAVAGVGALSVERWGRALVIVIEHAAVPAPLLAPIVASALEVAAGRPVSAALLVRDADTARVLVASEPAIAKVREWIASGTPWGAALTRLQVGS